MNQEELEKEAQQLLVEWERARKEHDDLRHQYFSSGSLRIGEPIRWPPELLTPDALLKLKEAWEKENQRRFGEGDLKQYRDFSDETIFAIADLLKDQD